MLVRHPLPLLGNDKKRGRLAHMGPLPRFHMYCVLNYIIVTIGCKLLSTALKVTLQETLTSARSSLVLPDHGIKDRCNPVKGYDG